MSYMALRGLVLPDSAVPPLHPHLMCPGPINFAHHSFLQRCWAVSSLKSLDVLFSLPGLFSPQPMPSHSACLSVDLTFSERLLLTTLFHFFPPLCLISSLASTNQHLALIFGLLSCLLVESFNLECVLKDIRSYILLISVQLEVWLINTQANVSVDYV